ncbi:MAG TPA: hypothetical protein VJZ94_01350 [Candidatus Paceibacterota bacterium]|nr:hypothetical protein [Candidatus Paceibacterota bacterium]
MKAATRFQDGKFDKLAEQHHLDRQATQRLFGSPHLSILMDAARQNLLRAVPAEELRSSFGLVSHGYPFYDVQIHKCGLSRDMRSFGWALEHDAEAKECVDYNVSFASIVHLPESCISEQVYLQLLPFIHYTPLGQRHAEALWQERAKLPERWRELIWVFPATVWCVAGSLRLLNTLQFENGSWNLGWLLLNGGLFRKHVIAIHHPNLFGFSGRRRRPK